MVAELAAADRASADSLWAALRAPGIVPMAEVYTPAVGYKACSSAVEHSPVANILKASADHNKVAAHSSAERMRNLGARSPAAMDRMDWC